MRREVGKETPKIEMDFYDVTRDILGFLVRIFLVAKLLFICQGLWFIQLISFEIAKN